MFIQIPILIIKEILILLVEKTIALGGVAIGIIKAQLAVKTTGRVSKIISRLFKEAKVATIGRKSKVVAVLLVTSVKNEIRAAIKSITIIMLKFPKKPKLPPSHSARPDD